MEKVQPEPPKRRWETQLNDRDWETQHKKHQGETQLGMRPVTMEQAQKRKNRNDEQATERETLGINHFLLFLMFFYENEAQK